MSKYHNKKTTVGGISFDSRAEANRYCELMLLLERGEIRNLKLQPEFTLTEAFITPTGIREKRMCYRADFSYEQDGRTVVEDVKGVRTEAYKIKRKLLADRGIQVVEIDAKGE